MSIKNELFFGLVGGIGVDFKSVIYCLKKELEKQEYDVHIVRLSSLIKCLESYDDNLSEVERIIKGMNFATQIRKDNDNNALLSILSIAEINKIRTESVNNKKNKIAYILWSLKKPEEEKMFRRIYGRNFILISVHSPVSDRQLHLIKMECSSSDKHLIENQENKIQDLIEKDFNEKFQNNIIPENQAGLKRYGQNVCDTFPRGHIFVNTTDNNNLVKSIQRFVDILFGHPFHTPTKDERNMFAAKGIALRSADLSCQVGAVIANKEGDIISTGCNDVPKYGGGFYEPDDERDLRDFKQSDRIDINVREKIDIVKDLICKISMAMNLSEEIRNNIECKMNDKNFYNTLEGLDTRATDLLEFGRSVHAEMEAICDAARRGVSVKEGTLYCTTYPCHMCAKLILAVGITRVVYIDPYPKSLAKDLFKDVIVESGDETRQLVFEAFMGISPRRYLNVFKQNNRKEDNKRKAKKAERGTESPYLNGRGYINYSLREILILHKLNQDIGTKIKDDSIREMLDKVSNNFMSLEQIPILKEMDISQLADDYWEDIVKK